MPLSPMSKSPRAADASRVVKPTCTKRGDAAEAGGEQLRDVDLEADDARRIGGIGLDERRAAFGVAAPAQFRRACAAMDGESIATHATTAK